MSDKEGLEAMRSALDGDPKAMAEGFRRAAGVLDEFRIRLHVEVAEKERYLIDRRVRVLIAPKPGWVPEWLWTRLIYWVLDIKNVRAGL